MRSFSVSLARTSRVRSWRHYVARHRGSRTAGDRPARGVPLSSRSSLFHRDFVFIVAGSNPILSVGADSTIAPLFAIAILKIALPDTSQYYSLVAATAVVAVSFSLSSVC